MRVRGIAGQRLVERQLCRPLRPQLFEHARVAPPQHIIRRRQVIMKVQRLALGRSMPYAIYNVLQRKCDAVCSIRRYVDAKPHAAYAAIERACSSLRRWHRNK